MFVGKTKSKESRRGVSTMMTLIFMPCLIVLTVMVAEIGSLYVAKTELRHSLESGALGAVQIWGGASDADDASSTAAAYVAANNVRNECVQLQTTEATFGTVFGDDKSGWTFVPGPVPDLRIGSAAVRLEKTQQIEGNVSEVFGLNTPNFSVTETVTARYDSLDNLPKLIRISD